MHSGMNLGLPNVIIIKLIFNIDEKQMMSEFILSWILGI